MRRKLGVNEIKLPFVSDFLHVLSNDISKMDTSVSQCRKV